MIKRIGLAWTCLLLAAAAPQPLWGYVGLAVPPATAAELDLFGAAKLSVAQAIAAIQQKQAGKVVEIGYATGKGIGWYSVLVAGGGGLHFLRVDPVSGAVSPADRADITRAELDQVGRRDLDAIATAKFDLARAVAAVTGQAGRGRVICAGVEQLGGVPQYYVTTVVGNKFGDWIVDPDTGQVLRPS